MSFGDHLEELRRCLLRGLIGVAVAIVVALFFAKDLLAFIMQPLLIVLHSLGQPPSVIALSPPEGFLVYLKVGFLSGLIVSMPWLLYQVWSFVAAGLYGHEQRFAKTFIPLTAVLFGTGVAFLYWVVLPVVLNFFVSFSSSLDMPELSPTWLQSHVLSMPEPSNPTLPEMEEQRMPMCAEDPPDPCIGAVWINTGARELRINTPDGLLVAALKPAALKTAVTSQFSLQFYISFVLSLALAFGLAFELPVIVVFLSLANIVRAAQMAKARKYVIFGIFVAAAMFTPPDVISQILLAVPMIALFEGGLLVARVLEVRRRDATSST